MKYFITLLLIIPIYSQAQCFTNSNGTLICPSNSYDFRNDSNSPKVYTPDGQYRGNLNGNIYDPNSISNKFGPYGNPYSPDSLTNPYAVPNGGYYGN
jgi:hypothetical protein